MILLIQFFWYILFVGAGYTVIFWGLKEHKTARIIMCASMLLLTFKLGQTDFTWNPYDLRDHLSTIQFMVQNHAIPAVTDGAESHQAPLYYIIGAILYTLTMKIGDASYLPLLYFSFFYFSFYLLYSAKIATLVIQDRILQAFALMALAFWPANLFHATRITNDIPLYGAMMAAIYYLLLWYQQRRSRYFTCFILATSLAFLFKSSALILLLFFIATCGLAFFKERSFTPLIRSLPARNMLIMLLVLLAVCGSFNFLRVAYYIHTSGDTNFSYLISDKHKRAYRYRNVIPIKLKSYISFNWDKFLNPPFWGTYSGRDTDKLFYWNRYLKSELYTQIPWNGVGIARAMNILLVAVHLNLAAMVCYGLAKHKSFGPAGIVLGYMVIIVGCMIAMQLASPEPGYADTRHIYSVVGLFIIGYFAVTERIKPCPRWLYAWTILLFGALILLFFPFAGAQLV